MNERYVHGYHAEESDRLRAQAGSVLELLHGDTAYPAGSTVLEVGCGTGAQTVTLAQNSPGARITSIDISAKSLAEAQARASAAEIRNVTFRQADLFTLKGETYDHVFVCFVLEHLPHPLDALKALKGLLRPGGSITVFEGDHGATIFHPHSAAAHEAIQCQVELQRRAGGNASIGRQVYPLLVEAGFEGVRAWPCVVYVDASRPHLADAFTRKTFTAMIEGVRDAALAARIIKPERFDQGIRDLYRTAEANGVFCYTFFKGVATRPGTAPR